MVLGRRHRLCARRAAPPRRRRRRPRHGSHLADGEAPLRERRRAAPDPRLRFLLPKALPLRLRQRSGAAHGGGGGRMHAGAARGARRCWRARGDPRRHHRRLRPRGAPETAGADLARADGGCGKPPRLPGLRRHPPHGGPLGLCGARLFARSAGRRRRRHDPRLPDAAAPDGVRDGCGAGARGDGLGPHGPRLPADLRLYRLNPLWGLALPAIAAIYTGFTVDSAVQHWQGRGGAWKGRVQGHVSRSAVR